MTDCHDNEITEMHLQITKTPVVCENSAVKYQCLIMALINGALTNSSDGMSKNIIFYIIIKWPWIFGLVLVSIVYGLGKPSKSQIYNRKMQYFSRKRNCETWKWRVMNHYKWCLNPFHNKLHVTSKPLLLSFDLRCRILSQKFPFDWIREASINWCRPFEVII